MQRTVGGETYLEQNFAFQLQAACFIRINRVWLEGDFHRSRRAQIRLCQLRPAMNDLLRSESAGRNALAVAAPVAFATRGDAVTEIRAGHRTLDSFGAARSVALSGTDWHIEATC